MLFTVGIDGNEIFDDDYDCSLLHECNPEMDESKIIFDHSKQACEEGNLGECHYLGWIYKSGEGAEPDIEKAIQLFNKTCDSKYIESCIYLADMYIEGDGVKKDTLKGVQFYTKACQFKYKGYSILKTDDPKVMGEQLCSLVGNYYTHVDGMQDSKKAIEFYKKGCDLNEPTGCFELSSLKKQNKDTD